MNSEFLQARITATQAMIVAYEDAINSLISGGVQEYLIDTGQNKQRVLKQDVNRLQDALNSLYNRCATMEARLNGGTLIIGPSF